MKAPAYTLSYVVAVCLETYVCVGLCLAGGRLPCGEQDYGGQVNACWEFECSGVKCFSEGNILSCIFREVTLLLLQWIENGFIVYLEDRCFNMGM